MSNPSKKDPLHGKTLQAILTYLVEHYGWEKLGQAISIKCFKNDPSISSSLTFLRRTPWAREKVENLYVSTIDGVEMGEEPVAPLDNLWE